MQKKLWTFVLDYFEAVQSEATPILLQYTSQRLLSYYINN